MTCLVTRRAFQVVQRGTTPDSDMTAPLKTQNTEALTAGLPCHSHVLYVAAAHQAPLTPATLGISPVSNKMCYFRALQLHPEHPVLSPPRPAEGWLHTEMIPWLNQVKHKHAAHPWPLVIPQKPLAAVTISRLSPTPLPDSQTEPSIHPPINLVNAHPVLGWYLAFSSEYGRKSSYCHGADDFVTKDK